MAKLNEEKRKKTIRPIVKLTYKPPPSAVFSCENFQEAEANYEIRLTHRPQPSACFNVEIHRKRKRVKRDTID